MIRSDSVRQPAAAGPERAERGLQANPGLLAAGSPAHAPGRAHLRAAGAGRAGRAGEGPGPITAIGPGRNTDAHMARPSGAPVPFDTSVPNVARMYNALLGGKDNFAADRAAVSKILDIEPGAAAAARQNRDFLRRAVRF